jgi:hypothetical protein
MTERWIDRPCPSRYAAHAPPQDAASPQQQPPHLPSQAPSQPQAASHDVPQVQLSPHLAAHPSPQQHPAEAASAWPGKAAMATASRVRTTKPDKTYFNIAILL